MEYENEFLCLQNKCYAIISLLLCQELYLAQGQAHTAGHKYFRWDSHVSTEAKDKPLHPALIFY